MVVSTSSTISTNPRTRRLTTLTGSGSGRTVAENVAAFKRHTVDNSRTTDITLSEAVVNPAFDTKLFQPPSQNIVDAFTFRVLQAESVPYVVQASGGGLQTARLPVPQQLQVLRLRVAISHLAIRRAFRICG
jgi:hypothetical protein